MQLNIRESYQRWGPLFLISCLSLFMELAVIRWVSGEIQILAYFKNLVLLAAFLGLAIGFALVGKKKDYSLMFPWLWLLFVAVVIVIGKITQTQNVVYPGGGDELIWSSTNPSFWISLLMFMALVIVFFFLIFFLFIPLGQATGEEMAKHVPIKAYIVNIIASLAGVWLFSALSTINSPPIVWFAVGLLGFETYILFHHKHQWKFVLAFIITFIGVGLYEPTTIWSPYNRLDLSVQTVGKGAQKVNMGYVLRVQYAYYQHALDLSDNMLAKIRNSAPEDLEHAEALAAGYSLPYTLISPGSKVLIVGSGMGNDVAAALRSQMGQVIAVEIDPAILQLGKKYHPEQPYDNPRVVTVVDDARSYFNKNQDKYDLVVFGLLDSHSLLSSMSSVRLDSFVYTEESFSQAKSHLNDHGYIALSFAVNEWIEERLGRMMQQTFGSNKVYYWRWMGYTTFIAGNSVPDPRVLGQFSVWEPNPAYNDLPLATDDWPYIYLRSLRIPAGYWQTLLIIILLCLFIMRRSFPDALKPDWHFWLLGASFLLIEFKCITELALLFGSTWFVNSLAISGVLMMALLANLYVLKTKSVNLRWVYGLLIASLIFGYFFPLARLAGFHPIVKGVIGTTVLCLPLFFAGMIFSESLRRYGETSRPIASNFSGSAVGGILEYGSIWWGIKSLYLVAIILYVGALLAAVRQRLLSK